MSETSCIQLLGATPWLWTQPLPRYSVLRIWRLSASEGQGSSALDALLCSHTWTLHRNSPGSRQRHHQKVVLARRDLYHLTVSAPASRLGSAGSPNLAVTQAARAAASAEARQGRGLPPRPRLCMGHWQHSAWTGTSALSCVSLDPRQVLALGPPRVLLQSTNWERHTDRRRHRDRDTETDREMQSTDRREEAGIRWEVTPISSPRSRPTCHPPGRGRRRHSDV